VNLAQGNIDLRGKLVQLIGRQESELLLDASQFIDHVPGSPSLHITSS